MKKTFILLVTLLLSIGAFAQSEVVRTLNNSLIGDNSIVRTWGAKQLIYTEGPNLTEMLFLLDSNQQIYSMRKVSMKNQYKIKDFAVRGDSVFFIGTFREKGFWGYFNIPNTFYGGDTITYFLTNTSSMTFSGPIIDDNVTTFVNFDELQTFTGSNGGTELLLTGFRKTEIYVGGTVIHYYFTPCLFHVRPPYTSFDYAFNNTTNEKFDDITLNGINIVVAGRENYTASDSANILFRIFDVSPFSLSTGVGENLTSQGYIPSMSKVLIESIGNVSGNVITTAHYGNLAPNQGLFIEYYSIDLNNNNNNYIDRNYFTFTGQGSTLLSGSSVKKIAYNNYTKSLCVLQDREMPLLSNSIKSAVCKFNLTGFPYVPCSTSYRTDNGMSMNSVTNNVNASILYSGKCTQYGAMLMKENVSSPSTCMSHTELTATTANIQQDLFYTQTPLVKFTFTATRTPFYSAPVTNSCNVICRQ